MVILILKEEYKKHIKTDPYLKAAISLHNNRVSSWTIDRWRKTNDPILTSATNLNVIRKHLNLNERVVLTEEKEVPEEKLEEVVASQF